MPFPHLPNMDVINFLAALALMWLLWFLIVKRGIRKLTCHRSFSRYTAFEGESGELIEVVRNDSLSIIPWLRVESYISPNLRLEGQKNVYVGGDAFYRSCFTLMPYQQIRRRHKVTFARRGVYDLGNASLSSGVLLGQHRYWKDQELSTPVVVYPRILEDENLPYPLSQMMGEIITKNRLLADPFLVRGIRPYVPGDLVRDIHWSATARTDELQVRVHDSTACTRLLVVLNAQQFDKQWDHYITEEHVDAVEKDIRLAASVCIHTLRAGLSVGFATNLPQQTQGKSTVISPAAGNTWQETLLESFAHLQLHRSEMFISLLNSLDHYTGTDILILSPYDSQGIQESIRMLQSKGNQVTFYCTEGGRGL